MSGVKMPFLSPPSSPPVSLYLLPLPPFSTGSILKKAPSALDGGGRGRKTRFSFFTFLSPPCSDPPSSGGRKEGGARKRTRQKEGRKDWPKCRTCEFSPSFVGPSMSNEQ